MTDFYLFGETAFLHEGDIDYLELLIEKVAKSKAKGIKFQVLTVASDFVSTEHSSYENLASYCFSLDKWRQIFKLTSQYDLDIIMMPLNIEALKLCTEFDVKYLEIHSVCNNDYKLKAAVRETKIDLILTTGGRFEKEIIADINFFKNQVAVLMVGFQAFPSAIEDVRLGQIEYWKNKFPNLLVGYADHSSFDSEYAVKSLDYAYLIGARVFEKHITLIEGEERVDFSSAIDIDKLNTIHENLLKLIVICNNENYKHDDIKEVEMKYRERQLICVASHDIDENTVLTEDDISLKMYHEPHDTFESITELVGRTCTKKLKKDYPFAKKNILE